MTDGAVSGSSQRSDWVLIGLTLAITLLGLRQVYSATLNTQFSAAWTQHCLWLVLGLGLFWLASRIDYHRSVQAAPLLWICGVLLLLAILLFTDPINGSKRWLTTPFGYKVQISEFMKVVLLLVVARYCGEFLSRHPRARELIAVVALFGVPVGLVVVQPDLSTALSMLPILGMALFLSKLRARHVVVACVIVAILVPVGWSMLKPYQKDRIAGFLDPEENPRSIGYQVRQSKIAVGSGGIWGRGHLLGSQTQLRFLPTSHTDFIFASFAEEEGFIGVIVMLTLYLALLRRIVEISQASADAQGTLLAMGVAALLLFHITVNVGMVVNKLPVTGLPLPLMSYGGSNLATFLILLGTVHSVHLRRYAV